MLKLLVACLFVSCVFAFEERHGSHRQHHAACHEDRVRLCPTLQPPYTAMRVLDSECFKQHKDELSPQCRQLFNVFQTELHLFRACASDWSRLCPTLQPPYTPATVFNSHCMMENKNKLSEGCAAMFNAFHANDGPNELPTTSSPSSSSTPYPTSTPHVSTTIPPSSSSGSEDPFTGDSLYKSCHNDIKTLCPRLAPPYTYHSVFHDSCMRHNRHALSDECRRLMQQYLEHEETTHHARARLFRVVLCYFGVAFVMVLGALSCCACCLCRARARRCRQMRCHGPKPVKPQPAPAKGDLEENTFEATEMKPVEMYGGYIPMAGVPPMAPMPFPMPPNGAHPHPQQFMVFYPQQFPPQNVQIQ